jgi:eukaryotic-like serine/threonine-protein kinase
MALHGRSPGAAADDPLRGTPYRLVRKLGAGGMGEVLLARHQELGRDFVVKVLHQRLQHNPQLIDRVRVEAQSLGRLQHENIVAVVGFGECADGRPYIAMEYLRGQTLAALSRTRRLPVHDAVDLTRQLLAALAAAHALGIVHRDIKPENLFLQERPGQKPLLKVLDFGLARIVPGVSVHAPMPLSLPTDTGVVVGTPEYLSPEAAGGQPVDHRADLYSAALVLYVLLAGRGPFDHIKNQEMVITAHAVEEARPPSTLAPAPIPPELDRAILKALSKDPAQRFQSAREFEAALSAVAALLGQPLGYMETTLFDPSRSSTPGENQLLASSAAPLLPASGSRQLGLFLAIFLITTLLVAAIGSLLLRGP